MARIKYLSYIGLLGIWILSGSCNNCFAELSKDREKFDIILISIDCLRPDHLGCYGYEKDTSPNIDNLAKEGIIFSKAISTSSWTLPAQISLFTSKYPLTHGVIGDGLSLGESDITLAEILKRNGFITAAFVGAPYMASDFGFNQGFDIYDDHTIYHESEDASHQDVTSPRLNEAVLNWLGENYHLNFFLFIHYWDTHYEYIPPPPYKENFENPYDGEIRFIDEHIGMLTKKLKEMGIFDNSLIILTADHGDEFMEHSDMGHRHSLYQEVIHIPFILKLPSAQSSNILNNRIDDYVSIIDIMPTIIDVSGIALPKKLEGLSLCPLIYGKSGISRPEIYAELFYSRIGIHQVSVIEERFKLIYYLDHPEREELFDLVRDPGEKDNLLKHESGEFRAVEERLFEKIEPRIKKAWGLLKQTTVRPEEYKKELRERLKSLGYIQ